MKMDWKQVYTPSKEELPAPCTLWPVDLKLSHIDCTPECTLVHFQGQYATIYELDYNILQVEIQNVPKTSVSLNVGEFCLVEDVLTGRWFRGRVQNIQESLFDVFLLDHGNVLTVDLNHLASVPDFLLMLPPKIVCGFFANVLPVDGSWQPAAEKFFTSMIGLHIQGHIHALLPYKVLILEVPGICRDLAKLNLGRHVDTETFLLLVAMLLGVPTEQSRVSVPDLLIEKQTAQEISFNFSSLWGFNNIASVIDSELFVGERKKVKVSAAVKPGLFYCQLSSVAKDLEEMSKKIELSYESRSNTLSGMTAENLGMLCAIKGKDDKWHRGFVQCLPVNSHIRVVFVDYGYCESIKVENIHQLPPDFLQRPIMAFPCSISCLKDKDEATKNQQLEILRNGLLGKELEITVDGFNTEKNVCMVTLNSAAGYNHNKALVWGTDEPANNDVTKNGYKMFSHRMWCTDEAKKVKITDNTVHFKDIHKGSTFEGYVEHVQSPHDFWMRTTQRNDSFKTMMNKLSEYFSGVDLNEEIVEDPVPGTFCCAMYEKDLHYYRAAVVDKLKHGAEVFFIDFGNTEKVPRMLVKALPKQFAEEPGFAVHCSLAHVAPKEDVWTVATIEFFRRVTSGKVFLVHVIHKRNDILTVELKERGSKSIATLMVRESMVEDWRYSLITPVELGEKQMEPDKKKSIDGRCHKSGQEQFTNVTTKQENVNGGKTNKEKQLNTDSPTRKINYPNIFRSQKVQPGAEISVICSHVNSPSDFWCQNKKQTAGLEKLMAELEAFYKVHSPEFQPHSITCAVKCQQNNKWYRGYTIGGNKGLVEVILVDYGKTVTEEMQNLRVLIPKFLELEGQAFRCSLYNLIEPVETTWSEEACTLFRTFVSENSSSLTCKIYSQLCVVNKGLCNVVDMHTPRHQVTTHLVQRKVAVQIQSPKPLVPSVYPCSFVYSSFNINVGDKELVYAVHVASPWEIYLQLDRNGEVIEQLMERVSAESKKLLKLTCLKTTNPVSLVKYFKDRKWYRSLVWPAQSSLHVNAFFVDYGNKQVAERCNVLPIPRHAFDLLLTPMQAIKCSLSNITVGENLPEVKAWLEKAILNKALQARFVAKNDSGHFICDLFDGDVNISEKVKELLACHEEKQDSLVKKTFNVCCREFKSRTSAGKYKTKVKTDWKNVEKMQQSPKHEKCIKNNRNKRSYNSQVAKRNEKPRCSYLKENPTKEKQRQKRKVQAKEMKCSTSETFHVQIYKTMPNINDLPAIKIKPGFKAVGYVSHCNSDYNFFIQMEENEQSILQMRELLNSKCFSDSMKNITWDIKIGDVLAAEYAEDLTLYRAVVTAVKSRTTVTVEFIDYGNSADVDAKKLYLLPDNFLTQSRLSIPCTLKGLHPDQSFTEGADAKPLMVEFMHNLGHAWEVCLCIQEPAHKATIHGAGNAKDDKVPDSEKNKQSNINHELEIISEAQNQSPLTSLLISEKTKKEKLRMKQEISTNAAVKTKEYRPKLRKLHQYKTLQKRSGRNTNSKKRLHYGSKDKHGKQQKDCKSNQPAKSYHCGVIGSKIPELSLELPACDGLESQDIQECQSTLVQPVLANACSENPPPPHLFFAPIKMDHEYLGFAAAVTTPGEFHIVLEDFILNMSVVSNILQNLPEELSPLPESHLIPGTGCLTMSCEKKKWCRAEIVQCDEVFLILNLVDYGHYARFPLQEVLELKRLPLELADQPKITYPCFLRGIKPAGSAHWSNDAVIFVQECMCQKTLQIYFRQYVAEAQWEVDVVAGDTNIAKELVEAGHACFIDKMSGIKFAAKVEQVEQISPDFADSVSEVELYNQEHTLSKKEEIRDTFSKSCDMLASGGETHLGQASGLTQCVLMWESP